jgi:CRISPR/Cas system CMR subunit Cmr4 (Cas7 group RAMP superfamily)
MSETKHEWALAKNELVDAIKGLGFPEELGNEVAKNLGSPKAMNRMCSYLYNVKPQKAELIVDEMLAIRSDIQRWKEKKEVEAANAWYNEFLYYGLDNEE